MSILKPDFTYVDLFSGIGGFRWAMENYSSGKAKCLYASEIDPFAARVYEANFGQKPFGDIRQLNPLAVDSLSLSPDVICGGFPCQTFSKGGQQKGFKDSRGTLFREIIRIVECYPFKKRPKLMVLENVQNLVRHDSGQTWKTIRHEISMAGYNVTEHPIIVSPKDVGVPQLRNRAIILAVRNDILSKPILIPFQRKKESSISFAETVKERSLSKTDLKQTSLSDSQLEVLDCWNDFIHLLPKVERILGFPIWSDEFGKTYDLKRMPKWRASIIEKNRSLYLRHKAEISAWMKRWRLRDRFTATNRKFEWQAGLSIDGVYDGIIQFRTSGVRVKKPTECPALVAMNHRPIYGPERRFITRLEAVRLQSFPDNMTFAGEPDALAFKQLGNAVNVKVIETIFRMFVDFIDENGGNEKND